MRCHYRLQNIRNLHYTFDDILIFTSAYLFPPKNEKQIDIRNFNAHTQTSNTYNFFKLKIPHLTLTSSLL